MKNVGVAEKKIQIGDIPAIMYRPIRGNKEDLYPTIFFYHGWSSSKESQSFRGSILASYGFQVILPDGIYHGERNPVDHSKIQNMGKYFWKVILNNIDESPLLIETAVSNYQADPNRIGVAGHSMGGYTAAGIFANNENIKVATIINGSCAWNYTNEQFAELFQIKETPILPSEQERIDELDPIHRIGQLKKRPMLILHGDQDQSVPIGGQRLFHKKMSDNNATSHLTYMEYPRIDHYVTTNMMEDMIKFFDCNL